MAPRTRIYAGAGAKRFHVWRFALKTGIQRRLHIISMTIKSYLKFSAEDESLYLAAQPTVFILKEMMIMIMATAVSMTGTINMVANL